MGGGKKFASASATIDRTKHYLPSDAVGAVKQAAFAKFDESVDIAVHLGVDPRHADQIVRGTVVLPHGTGKSVRVLVIAEGDKAREAEAAGADLVGPEYVDKIKGGWLDCDVVVATPDMMGKVGQVTRAQLQKIAEIKMPDLNANDIDGAIKIVAGTARSMGVEVID